MVYKQKRGNAQEPRADGISGCPYEFNCKTYIVEGKSIIVIFFSYMALLTLIYGDRMEKTREACCMAEQEGLSYREAERVVESDLFLDEYPQWDLGSPHHLVILHEMFLHAESQDRKRQNACATKAAKTM